MQNTSDEHDAPFFEITSKRRKGFPSETNVKRGVRIVHGNKELRESLVAMTRARAVQDAAFKKCLQTGRYDGRLRNYFFPRVIINQINAGGGENLRPHNF